MPLPEIIPVKYTEEDAECISVRPVVRQSFRLPELLDMILTVTGKDPARIQKVLRGGTIVFHFFRYRWEGFDATEAELTAALAAFPDAEPARAFAPELCNAVLLDTGSQLPQEWKRSDAMRKRFLRRSSLWDALLAMAGNGAAKYQAYSYDRKADLYAVPLSEEGKRQLASQAQTLLPAALRGPAAALPKAHRLLYVCPRA